MSVIRRINFGYFLSPQRFCRSLGYEFKSGMPSNYVRSYTTPAQNMSESEKMESILQKRFPKAKKIVVNDISGGCGSMYEIYIESIEFKGLPLVKQHMLINQTLKEHIKSMHGLTVKTEVADSEGS